MSKNAIGMVELISIARGLEVSDAMLKVADVELIESFSICPGKYMVLVGGDVASVQSSVTKGEAVGKEMVVDTFVIPNVHRDVFGAIMGTTVIKELKAVGIIETFSVSAIILAADASVKAAKIELIEVRLAKGLAGKGFLTLTGEVDAVKAAIDAGCREIEKKGLLVDRTVIPQPHEALRKALL
jgi:microcompartment protein CcmL/EutN